ncbi:Major facilitator superfamily protein [Rhynchospora pubera]|uniref:Major facilitator superfamily protein n=1 Tax=Rhynchospora pubera TaxID=906938 RepID=A0AAV8H3L3_9POAL|nr:Major facilitator superfamily protein [Rhynchospora pubera]
MGFGEERRTLVLVNLASIMERADEALLPTVYKEVGEAIHATPTGLGSLTLFRSIVQALCYPLAAYMATRHNRAHVIALGAFLWAAATFLVGISTTFLQVAISRGLNGIGLALVIPAIQSLVADSTDDETRGSAFGWLQFTGFFGSIFGGFFTIYLASTTVMGIAGWRIAFHLVALISTIVGFLVWRFAVDPNFAAGAILSNKGHTQRSALEEVKDLIKETKAVLQVPSFQIIVAQGVSGSFPWYSLSFVPMWFELIGFSHKYTGFLMTLFSVSTSIGGLFGGKMGDFLSRHFPNGGRIILSQISSGSAIPLAAVLLLVLPDDPSSGFSHAVAIFVMGFLISWNAAATNNPIFAEIVPEKSRTSIYALDRSFESILASFAPPIVGILAERMYGYKIGDNNKSDDPAINRENAASLAKALYTAIAIPMLLCCSIYSFLYCTYPRDRERAQMHSIISGEIQQIESEETSDIKQNDPQFQDIELVHNNERITDLVYEEPERNSSTEKLLAQEV